MYWCEGLHHAPYIMLHPAPVLASTLRPFHDYLVEQPKQEMFQKVYSFFLVCCVLILFLKVLVNWLILFLDWFNYVIYAVACQNNFDGGKVYIFCVHCKLNHGNTKYLSSLFLDVWDNNLWPIKSTTACIPKSTLCSPCKFIWTHICF